MNTLFTIGTFIFTATVFGCFVWLPVIVNLALNRELRNYKSLDIFVVVVWGLCMTNVSMSILTWMLEGIK